MRRCWGEVGVGVGSHRVGNGKQKQRHQAGKDDFKDVEMLLEDESEKSFQLTSGLVLIVWQSV